MSRLWQLLKALAANSVALDLEYRADFLVSAVTALLTLAGGAVVLGVMFSHARALGGWSFHEALALYGVYLVAEELAFSVMPMNIGMLPSEIRDGKLDFVLLKPMDAQLLVSVRRFPLSSLPAIVLGLGVILYSMAALGTLSPANLGLLALLFACGILVMYALLAMLLTTAFWWVRVENITELFHAALTMGRFPVSAFPDWLRPLLTFAVPIAFITTVPASAAAGRLDWTLALLAPLVAGLLLLASRWLWRRALAAYSSASS